MGTISYLFAGVRMAHCPECEAVIDMEEDDLEEGQTLSCPECDAELEVVSTNPLELNVMTSGDEEDEKGEEW